MRDSDKFTLAVFAFLLAVFVYGGIGSYHSWRTEQACLAQGYSSYRFSMWGADYCVLRKDQTDIVVPFHEAMRTRATETR